MQDRQCILHVTARAEHHKERQVNELDNYLLEPKREFEAGDSKKYEVEAIIDYLVYGQEINTSMPGLNYLVLWKDYPKEENIWKLLSAIIHLRKLINTFHKEHPEKSTRIFLFLDSASPLARPTVPKK